MTGVAGATDTASKSAEGYAAALQKVDDAEQAALAAEEKHYQDSLAAVTQYFTDKYSTTDTAESSIQRLN